MYRSRQVFVLAFAAMMTAQTACQTLNTQQEKGAVIGAGSGAVVGGVIGKATGSTARGAIIGAVVGGAAGAIIGHQMDQKAKEIQATVAGAEVTRVGEGLVVTFASGLLFDTDSSSLRAESKKNLDNLASSLSNFGDSKLLLVGRRDRADRHKRFRFGPTTESARRSRDLRERQNEGRREGPRCEAVARWLPGAVMG